MLGAWWTHARGPAWARFLPGAHRSQGLQRHLGPRVTHKEVTLAMGEPSERLELSPDPGKLVWGLQALRAPCSR